MDAEPKQHSPMDVAVGLFAFVAALPVWFVTAEGFYSVLFGPRRVESGDWGELFAFVLLASGLTCIGLYFGRR